MTRKLSRDHYFQKAKKDGYAARSIYKLEELDKRFRLLAKGMRVLDLGASPGSWSQYASAKVGPKGSVLALDLKPPRAEIAGVEWLVADVEAMAPGELLDRGGPFDLLLSDMAPSTTGNKNVDAIRSVALAEAAFGLAREVLRPGGAAVVKVFMGQDFPELMARVKAGFKRMKTVKPKASLKESRETYILAWEPKV